MKVRHNSPKPRDWYYSAEWKRVRPYSPKLRAWYQRVAKPYLEACEEGYQSGEKDALMAALAICAVYDLRIPLWVRLPLGVSYFQTRPESWDDIFGRPVPKGKSVRAFNRHRHADLRVVKRVKELAAQGTGVDDDLFAVVGKEFGMSAGGVKEVYYNKRIAKYFDVEERTQKALTVMHNEIGRDPSDDTVAAWLEQDTPPHSTKRRHTRSRNSFLKTFLKI
jgi:hypothetical protein